MTAKQWMLITVVIILNIIIFGALLGPPEVVQQEAAGAIPTPYPTFTPTPFPTATAIVMPTIVAEPTLDLPTPVTIVHVVTDGETLTDIAEQYDVGLYVLRMVNRIPESAEVQTGQELVIPAMGN